MDLMIFASGADNRVVPRAFRRNLFVRLIMPCCLPAWADLTLPEAVILNRFLQLDFVFIFGISVSIFWFGRNTRLGMPYWPDARVRWRRIGRIPQ